MTTEKIYICVERNYYHNKSGYLSILFCSHTMQSALTAFEEYHQQQQKGDHRLCDYCYSKWKINKKKDYAIRQVDHDGAFVEYEIITQEVKP